MEDFAVFLNNNKKSYYVSYFTASEWHGASHQRVYTYFLNLKNKSKALKQQEIEQRNNDDNHYFYLKKGGYRFKIHPEHTFPPKHETKIPPKTLPFLSEESGYIGLNPNNSY